MVGDLELGWVWKQEWKGTKPCCRANVAGVIWEQPFKGMSTLQLGGVTTAQVGINELAHGYTEIFSSSGTSMCAAITPPDCSVDVPLVA